MRSLRTVCGRTAITLIQRYTRASPLRRGKLWLSQLGMRFARHLPGEVLVTTVDGGRMYADLSTGMCESLYFLGEFEPGVSGIIRDVVKPGQVCLDLGANFGWYTTLLHRLTGPDGEVHAFEPVPESFARLQRNVSLLDTPARVHLNNLALGRADGTLPIHLFDGLPNGHASLSTMGRTDFTTIAANVITLDGYLEASGVSHVDFVKVDIEGAERAMLEGAGRLMRQTPPPTWMIEMALGTTKGFGYLPNDLIDDLRRHADYRFLAVNEFSGAVRKIERFAPDDAGSYVLCQPASRASTSASA